MSSSQHILIYAELLSRLRQVSVGCVLPTPALTTTQATVAPNGRTLTVAHDGSRQTIQLPGKVVTFGQLPVERLGDTRFSWKLSLSAHPSGRPRPASDELVPWSAIDLETGSAVACRACSATVVEPGVLKVWKDLPSENWAEMMEFWHCHKPHNHGDNHGVEEEHLADRGYGASSRIGAQPGVGFIDLTSFLLAESDLVASSISPLAGTDKADLIDKETTTVHCASCRAQLGVRNDQVSSVSLFKWQVSVRQQKRDAPVSSPSIAQCVSAMLLATMARSGCSKSVLLPTKARLSPSGTEPQPEDASQGTKLLHIWVFNANIIFSSTEASTSPTNAVKLFYRMITQEEADKMLDSVTSDVQDISLPLDAIATIVEILSNTTNFLPESDRSFKEWAVGLLDKW